MKYIKIYIIFFIIFIFSTNSFAGRYGTGELKLSNSTVNFFIDYIRGKQSKFPADFYVTLDGTDGTSWYCSEMTNCSPGSLVQDLADCLRKTGKECKQFARKRTIRWQNGINPGKGKASRINSKLTDQEIRSRLKELGFLD